MGMTSILDLRHSHAQQVKSEFAFMEARMG